MWLVLTLAARLALASSANAATPADDWSTRCAIFHSAIAWTVGHRAEAPVPEDGENFSRSPNDVVADLPPVQANRLAAPPTSPWAFEFRPSLRCNTRQYVKGDFFFVFAAPRVDADYGWVDLQQFESSPYSDGAYSYTRLLLRRVNQDWRVLKAVIYENHPSAHIEE